MNIIDVLQKGSGYVIASKTDVEINAGKGNSEINIAANNVTINTDCGDQEITVLATGDLSIDTGDCGKDTINARANGNATIQTRESADTVNLAVGGTFKVSIGSDNPPCGSGNGTDPDNDKVTIYAPSAKGENFISTGEGNDTVHLIAENVDVKKGEGQLTLGFVGSDYNINSDAEYTMIAGWGDDVNMNLNTSDKANNNVYSFDQLWSDPNEEVKTQFTTNFWQGNAPTMLTNLALADGSIVNFDNKVDSTIEKEYKVEDGGTKVEEELIDSTDSTVTTESYSGMTVADIAKRYNIPEAELKKYDLSATLSDGTPKYAILGRYGGRFYQIYERQEGNKNAKLLYANGGNGAGVQSNNFKTDISTQGEATKTTTYTTTTTDTYKVTTTKYTENALYRKIEGVKNWTINAGDGKLTGHITTNNGKLKINGNDACNDSITQDIKVDSGYINRQVLSIEKEETVTQRQEQHSISIDKTEKIAAALKLLQHTIASPLILDVNGDGKVSAKAGAGVDINNDGKADGAATDGDKMLAMTDLNGNGKIDGAEVFGDKTVSPFSGKSINAANGFEALKAIAEEAKQYTGIDCMNGSKVDVKKLQQALAKVGVSLGFISDDNVSNLENLYGVSTIDVGNYTTSQRTGNKVEHLQHSTYTDENGVEFKVDDVWFEI